MKTPTGIAPGDPANFVSLDIRDTPHVAEDAILDCWIFTNAIRPDCVWVNGRKLVGGGTHVGRGKIAARFHSMMRNLLAES